MAAQSMHETSDGKHCYNWNLGNVKSPRTDNEHMYLQRTWEVYSPQEADEQVREGNGLAHIATSEERKKHGWPSSQTSITVVFQPPHKQTRFRAYQSLEEGACKWATKNQRTQQRFPELLKQLNSADHNGLASTLKKDHYYSGSQTDYSDDIKSNQIRLDKELGPIIGPGDLQ